jgi:DNA-binding response OmpR family regulator
MTTERQPRVLVVDDELTMREFLEMGLGYEGFEVRTAADGTVGLETARTWAPDLVILDRMLPGLDGIEICRRLRAGGDVAVLMLSARGDVDDRIEGFDAGADDYLPKPFALEELLARLRALGRRPHTPLDVVLRFADLELDTARRLASRGQREIRLTAREYAFLEYMMRHPNSIRSRSQILDHVWDDNFDPVANAVDVLVGRVRRKVDAAGERPLIHTVRGMGYLLGMAAPREA